MTVFFTEHARERARERYGLDLTDDDAAEIVRATKDGRAQMMARYGSGGRVFIWTFRGRLLIAAMAPDEDVIRSFLPSDYFLKNSRHTHKIDEGTMKPGPRRNVRQGQNYRRPKSNRRRFADVEE